MCINTVCKIPRIFERVSPPDFRMQGSFIRIKQKNNFRTQPSFVRKVSENLRHKNLAFSETEHLWSGKEITVQGESKKYTFNEP